MFLYKNTTWNAKLFFVPKTRTLNSKQTFKSNLNKWSKTRSWIKYLWKHKSSFPRKNVQAHCKNHDFPLRSDSGNYGNKCKTREQVRIWFWKYCFLQRFQTYVIENIVLKKGFEHNLRQIVFFHNFWHAKAWKQHHKNSCWRATSWVTFESVCYFL